MRHTDLETAPWRSRWILVLWGIQPVSILVEVVVAAFVRAPYNFVHNTISDLGAVSCTSIAYPARLVPVCSPAHALLNATFVLLGTALVAGAVLMLRERSRSRLLSLACTLWVICGLSTVAAGFVPLDVDLELHSLVSAPAIVLQPFALALHASAYARQDRRWLPVVVAALLVATVAVFFLVRLEVQWGGLLERLAIWPVLLAMPLLAAHHVSTRRPAG